MKNLILVVFLFIPPVAVAQKIFTEVELLAVVKQFHPVAKQAFMDVQIAEAHLTTSRGNFDPVAIYNNGRKSFDGVNYYYHQLAELKIPTWYGVDIYAGRENIEGSRVSVEDTRGVVDYVGISVPLVQNLFFDKRRAILQQAKAFRQQSEEVRRGVVNDLLADALQTYWSWWEQHQLLTLLDASIMNASARLEMVKATYRIGELAAIDTLEAATQVQNLQQRRITVIMNVQKARMEISTYLWSGENIAYELPSDAIPENNRQPQITTLDSLLGILNMHPELVQYQHQLQVLDIERRLKLQSLLPQVNAKYNFIGRNFNNAMKSGFFDNNYQFGISMSMPLRLSAGRGEFKASKLKLEQARLDQVLQRVMLMNRVRQYYVEWQQTLKLLEIQYELVSNYNTLLKAEEVKFSNGESSLFLINAREIKAIEEHQKAVELSAKIRQAEVRAKWGAGLWGL